MEKPITNLSDPRQVAESKHRERRRSERESDDLKSVLQTTQGRRVMWRLLEHCGVFETVWHPSALIHYNAGKQDVGHFIMQKIISADSGSFAQMMQDKQNGEI